MIHKDRGPSPSGADHIQAITHGDDRSDNPEPSPTKIEDPLNCMPHLLQ
jgi:hypothetical protein